MFRDETVLFPDATFSGVGPGAEQLSSSAVIRESQVEEEQRRALQQHISRKKRFATEAFVSVRTQVSSCSLIVWRRRLLSGPPGSTATHPAT